MITNIIKRNIIRLFDFTLPLSGELSESGVCILKNHVPEETLCKGIDSIVSFITNDISVKKIVASYTRRSNIEFVEEWDAPDKPNSSGLWHHDSVGHRIKGFVALTNATGKAGTEYVLGTHLNTYSNYNDTRVELKNGKHNIKFIQQNRGDVLLFDTNGLHRGIYGEGKRKILQVEFGTGFKGRIIPGHIGKR